jgi:hypothetical protein
MPQRTTAEPSWEQRFRDEGGPLLNELKELYAVTPDCVFSMEWVDPSNSMLALKDRGITVEVYAGKWGGKVCLFARGFRQGAAPYFRHYFPNGPRQLLNFMRETTFQ